MFDIIAILIPIILAICIVMIIRIINDTTLRKRLAETQTEKEIVDKMLDSQAAQSKRSLFCWGFSILMAGFAMTIIGILELGADDPLSYGIIFIAAGCALLFCYQFFKSKS